MMRRGYKELLKEAVEKLKDRLAAGHSVYIYLHVFISTVMICLDILTTFASFGPCLFLSVCFF